MSEKEDTNTLNKRKAIEHVMLLYNKQGYFNLYGPTVLYFIFIIFILFLTISFTTTMMNIKDISDNWEQDRCNPSIMPFAGFINKPSDKSFLDYTSENYQYCVQNILKSISGSELEPFNFIVSAITELFSLILNAINAIKSIISSIRDTLTNIMSIIAAKLINIVIPIQYMIIKLNDLFNKSQTVFTTGMYTVYSIYFMVISFFDAFVNLMLTTLIALVIVIFILLIFFNPYAIVPITMFTLISIPLALIINFISEVFGTPSFPGMPKLKTPGKCFDKDTNLKLINGNSVKISDICIGDILHDGSIIQSYLILERGKENMYKLNNVILSGSHSVLYKDKWIYVANHPNIELVSDYNEPFLYCLNTSTKNIVINDTTFSDWDEILVNDIYLKLLRNISKKRRQLDQVHRFYNKGFPSSTLIELKDGTKKSIIDINIGDELKNVGYKYPIHVYGKVMIDSQNLIYGNLLDVTNKYTKSLGSLYHLLTNEGFFYINDNKYFDYNACIDLYIENSDYR